MTTLNQRAANILFCILMVAVSPCTSVADSPAVPVAFVEGQGRVAVVIDGMPIAVYSYADEQISRPYFAHVRAPAAYRLRGIIHRSRARIEPIMARCTRGSGWHSVTLAVPTTGAWRHA